MPWLYLIVAALTFALWWWLGRRLIILYFISSFELRTRYEVWLLRLGGPYGWRLLKRYNLAQQQKNYDDFKPQDGKTVYDLDSGERSQPEPD